MIGRKNAFRSVPVSPFTKISQQGYLFPPSLTISHLLNHYVYIPCLDFFVNKDFNKKISIISGLAFQINLYNLENFCALVEGGYNLHGNPYHNAIHGADILVTTHNLLTSTGFAVSIISLLSFLRMVIKKSGWASLDKQIPTYMYYI